MVELEHLGDDLLRRLSGDAAEAHAQTAIPLCTIDDGGWPHVSMLSYFEVVAVNPRTLRIAVYNTSRSCANLRARAKATLLIVDDGLVAYVKGTAEEVHASMPGAPYNAVFSLRIDQVLLDEASPKFEPGVRVTSGITHSPRMPETHARAAGVLEQLRKQPR